MCTSTSKLCYCAHRSPAKWVFCADSETMTASEDHPSQLTTQPCKHAAANQDTVPERCAGRLDFCCSSACCAFNLKAARNRYDHTLTLFHRRGLTFALASTGEEAEASTVFEKEAEVHVLCDDKRKDWTQSLRYEQPCLFESALDDEQRQRC